MEEEVAKEEADKDWEAKKKELKAKEDAKTNKNKAKREKAKARKEAKKGGGSAVANGELKKMEKKLGPHKGAVEVKISEDGDDEGTLNGTEVKAVEDIGIVIHDDD